MNTIGHALIKDLNQRYRKSVVRPLVINIVKPETVELVIEDIKIAKNS